MLLLNEEGVIIEANKKARDLLLINDLIGEPLEKLLEDGHKELASNPEGTRYAIDGNGHRLLVDYGYFPASKKHPGSFAFVSSSRKPDTSTYQLQSYLTNSPLGVIEFDRDMNVLKWSKRAEEIFGWEATEVIGRLLSDIHMIYPEDQEIVQQVIDELQSGSVEGISCFNRNITKDNQIISCVWYNSVLKDENGHTVSILSFVQDVTEHKRIEELWLESKREITPFFSNTLSGFFFMELNEPLIWDANLDPKAAIDHIFEHARVTRTNRALLDQYRAEESDLIGLSPGDFFPGDVEAAKKIFLEFVQLGRIRTETREQRIDGTYFWVEGDYTALYNDKGHLIGLFGIQHDITSRKEAQEQLETSESKFRTLFEQASDGILLIDSSGKIKDANSSMCQVCGLSLEQLMTTPLDELISPKSSVLNRKWYEHDLSVEDFELYTDTEVLAVEISTRKQPDGITHAIVRNVTERRLAERKLKENEQLLKKVGQMAKIGSWKLTILNQIELSEETQNLLGLAKSQISLKEWLELFDEESAQTLGNFIKRALATGESFDLEADLSSSDVNRCVRIHGARNGSTDFPNTILGAIQDITEEKNYNKKLEHEKSLSDAIINSMPGVFYFFNQEGKYIRWNKILEDVSGHRSEDIANGHPLMFFAEDQHQLLIEKITSVFENGYDQVEADLKLKDGTRIPYFFTGSRFIYEGEPCLLGLGQDIREQRKAKDELLRTNEQLKAAQSIANVGYWEWDLKSNSMYWSEEMYKIFGSRIADGPIPYEQFLKQVEEEDRDGVKAFMNGIHVGGYTQFEYRYHHPERGTRIIRAKAIALASPEGEITKMEGAVQDITDTKKREEQLSLINERYELISKATNDAIWDWDISVNNTLGNSRMYELYGVAPGENINDQMFYERLHPQDLSEVKSSMYEALQSRNNHLTKQYRFKHADGSYRDIMDRVYILYNEKGQPKRMLGAMQDITAQKESERQLQEASNRLLLAATSASLGIFDWNLKTGRLVWNEYMYSIFSVDPDEFHFEFDDWIHCLHPRDVVDFNEKIETAIERGRPFHDRFRIVWPNNEIRHIEAHALVSRDSRKDPLSMIGVCRDITDSINAEQEIAKAIIDTQEEERFETGRELHDHIIQLLVAARMNLNHVIDKLQDYPSVQRSFELTGSAIEDIRKLSHRLAPASLEATAIDEAMSSLLESINSNEQYQINYETEINTEIPIPSTLKLNLYRILQEQLNNIIKHAKASQITVELIINDFKISLVIADDGKGFDSNLAIQGIGLNNIRRRVEIFNGHLQVITALEKGFKLIVEIPRETDEKIG